MIPVTLRFLLVFGVVAAASDLSPKGELIWSVNMSTFLANGVCHCVDVSHTQPQVIYVARNPKDVSVSLYHHVRNKQKDVFDGNESDMIRCFVQGRRVKDSRPHE